MKIVCTMTSYPGRIKYVAKAIYRFIMTQTVKPDYFYLWLAEQEFPNKEKDLPEDLLLICEALDVKICWTKENEYCFKRWYIYPTHFNDYVFSIDDDNIYQKDLIEQCLKINKEFPNTIITIPNLRYCRIYKNSIHNEQKFFNSDVPDYRFSFCGQCFIPPGCFPLNGFTPELNEIRKEICPVCDESWFNPWLIYNGIKSYHPKQLKAVDSSYSNINALWRKFDEGGKLNKRDKQLYIVLNNFPMLMNKWKETFPTYKC